MHNSVALAVRADLVELEAGAAAGALAGQVTLANSRVGIVVADRADMRDSPTVILLAREVHGPVETVLDTRGALLAGLVAGVAIGMVLLVVRLLGRRH
jgi:hypothetical protein